jgi:hypothetical protein
MNRIIRLAFALFLPFSIAAQDIDSSKPKDPTETSVQFGLKTGVNSSFFSVSINSEGSNKTGFHIGMYVRKQLSRNFTFRPELYYSSQGQKDNYIIPSTNQSVGHTTTTINALNIPILFEVGRKVNFQFGPQIGLLVSGREKGTINNEEINDDLQSIMKDADLSLVLGVGYSPWKYINFGMRYNMGFTPIFKKPENAPSDFPTVSNRVYHFFVGFSF